LTPRESEIPRWVANGKSAWQIGGILQITKRSVDDHVPTAVRKTGAANRTHGVAIGLRGGIIKHLFVKRYLGLYKGSLINRLAGRHDIGTRQSMRATDHIAGLP
jgi:DNA-binding CsgD family transcriptional regulator